jgi:hypothetical protein
MDDPKQKLVRALKANRAVRWLNSTTFAEVALETLNTRLPLNYRVMRLVSRSNHLRRAAIHRCSQVKRSSIQTTAQTVVPDLDVNKTANELHQKGFATGLVLPSDYIGQILDFCATAPFIDDYSKEKLLIDPLDGAVPRPGRLAYRCSNPHKQCEAVDRLTRDPALVEVARRYLTAEPLLRSSRIFWSYPDLSEGYNPLYGFHYDIDDYKFLKLFFYLCDVDQERGPHVIIEGTHKQKDWFEKNHRRLTDEQAESRYAGRIKVMLGETGQGFFEDTFCYHKGAKPRKRRLMLEFQYAISAAAVA